MIAQWLVYALAVSLLVSVAAWLAEQGARAQRWPTRWVWPAATAASLAVPLVAWLAPASPESVPSVVAAPTAYVIQSIPVALDPLAESGPAALTVALAAWGVLSVLLLATIGVLAARLVLRRRGWRRRTVAGVDVWVSRNTGPAALGVLRGQVVVPEWALELDAERRRLLVEHEAEHVRARDPQLALAGLVVCALVPWNLPLWWQLRRLRLAIEMDCDERVLRRAEDARGYGSLLLEVSQRKAHLALALAESQTMLERRIRMIAETTKGPRTLRAASFAAVAGLVLAAACETPGPMGPADLDGQELTVETVKTEYDVNGCQPTWFINGSRSSVGVADALDPTEIDEISVFTGEDIQQARDVEVCAIVSILTKNATVDEAAAARRLVEELTDERPEAAGVVAPSSPPEAELADGPAFTPMTVRPQLRNADEAMAALEEFYPPLLKNAGIEGTVNVWFFIDAEGTVQRALINETSGYDALDQAALKVAERMEFTPAYNRDVRVPVWVALDVTFDIQR